MSLARFWYVACESGELGSSQPRGLQILDEWIVCFRDSRGQPVAFPDRCLHRCGRLSRGRVREGELTCGYHGWTYDGAGRVVSLPAEGGRGPAEAKNLRTTPYETCEQDGYVYIKLEAGGPDKPYSLPSYRKRGHQSIRLVHDFENTVTNCVENFIDVPHTAFVHEGIFRSEKGECLKARVIRQGGEVHVTYLNEGRNLGSFSWFLNPGRKPVHHTDSFLMPNITHVVYRVGEGRRIAYDITSQSVPMTPRTTRVYTDITYRFGILSRLARPLARRQARRVIRQDIDELNAQMEVIEKFDGRFIDSPADRIHKLVSQIRDTLEKGGDPDDLPDHESTISFWV